MVNTERMEEKDEKLEENSMLYMDVRTVAYGHSCRQYGICKN